MTHRIALIGNSTHANRGCEAIARGTMAVFQAVADQPVELASGVIVHTEAAADLVSGHTAKTGEPPIVPLQLKQNSSFLSRVAAKITKQRPAYRFPGLADHLKNATSALEVGGDNYSLDYGRPYPFIDMDAEVQRSGIPLAIWGASIGPFSSDPEFEAEILGHFRSLKHVFVRESVSYAYLTEAGLSNVTQMADPAIFMKPEEPTEPGFDVDRFDGAFGLNLSPFQARQVAGTKTAYWETSAAELDGMAVFGAELLSRLLAETDRPVLLVPHVMAADAWNNDWMLLTDILKRLEPAEAERVALLPKDYNAPQLKWALSKCSVFAGSRTHATLGAISSGVPTLAFGYSRKATGLMRDLYGHDEMCLPGNSFTLDNALEGLRRLLAQEDALRATIADRLPELRAATMSAARGWLLVK